MASEIRFVVPGQAQAASPAALGLGGQVLGSVRVGARRGAADSVRLTARPGEDMVVLSIANGPTLVLHPESARDLLQAQAGAGRQRSAADGADDGSVQVPAQLGWDGGTEAGATRGWLGEVLLNAVDVVKGLVIDHAADIVSTLAVKKLDGQVDAGVYALGPDALPPLKGSGLKRAQLPAAADGGPLLVLLHGTFVDTASTFGKLWTLHPQVVARLFAHYGQRVYALDHPTLAHSPIANALTLVRALPAGARLHLLTHSRGGLVAEVLARACSAPLGDDELALFADLPEADGQPARSYAQHRQDLQALVTEARAKRLQVERVLRVACPARGTLLAGRRLDAYLSVLKWGLELAGLPVAPELLGLLSEVAQRRHDPAELPGLEAMTPDSPVVQWLNAGGEPLSGQLRVLAGDIEGDSLMSWVKTLLADAFYWTDNDLVVQTRSMYGGTPRAQSGASFVLERGAKVSHFNYFANERSVQAVASGLIDEQPADFRLIGPLSWAGQDASGTRGALAIARSRGADAAERPAVVVLPGILGSNLALDGKRIWLGLRLLGGLQKLAWDPARADRVAPDGAVGLSYDDLLEHLAQTHEVIEFAYDWRRPIEHEARRLGAVVDDALARRDGSGQPVRLLAHSMGGLVARTMQLECPDTWERCMARSGARLLMLGTPNGGSWAPMQVLSGDDSFGNTLVAFGGLFDEAGTRQVMAGMPGFLQLQAGLTDPALALDRQATWQKLADDDQRIVRERNRWHRDERQLSLYRWGAPPQAVLDQAVALRRRLDAQAAALGPLARQMLLVVGHEKFTPAGFRLGEEGLEYLDLPDGGDGRVTLHSALLPGVATWRCDATHGKLPDERSAFEAYVELLERGDTQRLPRLEAAATRGGAAAPADAPALVPNRPSRSRRSATPPSLSSELFAGRSWAAAAGGAPGTRLELCVLNGNLKFVNPPLLLGHYVSGRLSGAEAVVDALIGGALGESLAAGLYPSQPQTHQVFVNTRLDPDQPLALPRPAAMVVLGLGEEGRLRPSELADTVRQGVLAYAQRQSEQAGGTGFELAATLIGSGGVGVHVGSAAQAIAQGVAEANQRLRRNGWPLVTRLQLVELYLDRATEAHNALAVLAESRPQDFALQPTLQQGVGAMRRPGDSGYRGAGYDFITAVQRCDGTGAQPVIEYTLDTQRARNEVRGQATQAKLVDELVCMGADSNSTDTQIGRSLFQLLVPVEIEPFLAGSRSIVLQLDQDTARLPWELLDTGSTGQAGGRDKPWAVRTQVLRKLRTDQFRSQPVGAGRDGGVLVIGEPQCDKTRFAELPGARQEALAVAQAFGVPALIAPDALQAVNALLAQPLRIVHISGHGEHRADGSGGVILSNDTVLGPAEIGAMRHVPELVFVNCCFIGQIHPDPAVQRNALGARRSEFAAGVAEQLIRNGVRCVVAAGWAVEDGPAMQFALRFYQRLLAGDRFIDAVGAARLAAWDARPAGNTWAAYQCYGDPDWRYLPPEQQPVAQTPKAPDVSSAPALALLLENEAIDARYADQRGKAVTRRRLDRLRQLQARYATLWGDIGAVAEAFGVAFAEAGDLDAAIEWLQRALRAGDASASMRAGEQLGNLLARRGARRDDATLALQEIDEALALLQQLATLQPTVERENLLGSAWKRRAMVAQGNAMLQALLQSQQHYGQAEALARASGAPDLFYPLMNGLAVELRLAALQGRPGAAIDPARLAAAQQSLQAKGASAPDFWSVAALSELRMLEAVARRQLAAARSGIEQGFADLAQRAPAAHLWRSVHDQATFVLQPYASAAGLPAAEAAAARALLKKLQALAA